MKKYLILLFLYCIIPLQAQTITAHSGAYNTPDNSLEYIRTALGHHAQILEIDIRMRPDGTIAMAHDEITNNSEGTDILTVLQLVKKSKNTLINLDIKQTSTLSSLYKLLGKTKMKNRVFLTGIELKDAGIARKECPGIPYYLNCKPTDVEEALKEVRESGSIGLNINYSYATKELVSRMQAEGFKVSLWTLDKEEDMPRIIGLHPDNITSRFPLKVQACSTGSHSGSYNP